ncbi:phage replication initiation protein [Lactobacillus plantarum] [Lactiplantibacillus mudanjiangensis]|uniref:replisome organizer n=1 Tax=Lactiplantibacillus mudanjiangensis TaxID=1296538 RepID=UPI0010140D5B|nr:phage replication initiation protein [Lactobacillus plantarum] [Lactiplantibacillus mudanjiangensis]
MAQRRMMSKQITETDLFMDLPLSSQALYLHLIMNADDDGFLGNAKTVLRMAGASNDDFKLLVAKQFIIVFDDGITVIKDWRIHNYIQKDRYRSTMYIRHKKELAVDKNQSYQRISDMDTECIQDVSSLDTQVRLGKDRIGKVRKEKNRSSAPENTKHKYGEYKNVLLSDKQLSKLQEQFPNDWQERIERVSGYVQSTGKHYKDYLATIRNWAKRDQTNKQKPHTREDWFT